MVMEKQAMVMEKQVMGIPDQKVIAPLGLESQ
jgi:hypothetical protein